MVRPANPALPLAAGTVLAGRYQIGPRTGPTPYGDLYRATDTELGLPVAVRALRADLLAPPGALERLNTAVREAAALEHKNIVRTLGLVSDKGAAYLVTQAVSGGSVRALMSGRGPFSLKGAYNVIAHLCNALAHAGTVHGGLCGSAVLVNKAGRVKLSEWGLGRAFPQVLARSGEAPDRAAVAPEVAAGKPATQASDLYALGALLFELLTGKAVAPGMLPRQVVPSLPADIDPLVSCLLSRAPEDRFPDAATVKQALARVLDGKPDKAAKPSAPKPVVTGPITKVDPDDEVRWLVTRDKMDFGPYSMRQLRDEIAKDAVQPGNILMDNDSGQRIKVEEHPDLHDLIQEAAQRRADAKRAEVEENVVQEHTRKGVALYGIIAAAAIALGVGGFFIYRAVRAAESSSGNTEGGLLAVADVKGLKVSGVKKVERAKKRSGTARPGTREAAGPAWDDSQAMDLSSDESVGDERLDDSQINETLARHGGSLGRCLQSEIGRGGVRSASIDFIVLGTGRVSAVRVNGQTGGALAGCIRGAMQAMKFPTFNGPRTKASFDINM